MSIKQAIREAFAPTVCNHPAIKMERVEVVSEGMVKTITDEEARPIDGPTGATGWGVALTIDGHRHFLPYL